MPDRPCVFCAIVADDDPSVLVHRDEHTAAFLDRRPVFHGHVLVVPREHHVTLDQVPPTLLEPIFATVQRCMAAIASELGAQGTFVAANNVVSQSVPHLHVHVVPRTKGDGLRGFFWPRHTYAAGQMEAMQHRLRTAIGTIEEPAD